MVNSNNQNDSNSHSGTDYTVYTWTPKAVQRLALIVSATIRHRGMTRRGFTDFVNKQGEQKISPNTLNRIAGGTVKRPAEAGIRAIAPYVYRFESIQGDVVKMNPLQTYSGVSGWVELVSDVFAEDLHEERLQPPSLNNFGDALINFILDHQDNLGLTQRNFEKIITEKTGLTSDRLRRIIGGAVAPTDADLYWLGCVIKDTDDQFYPWEFWQCLKSGIPADACQKEYRVVKNAENQTN